MDSVVPEFVAAHRLIGDRYRLERFLGGGGMATVWGGRDLRLDRPVAIKELSGEGLRQPMALERFDREARAVGRLSHPNVVSVYDVGTHDGQPYLVMELVEGRTIATLLDDGPLPIADVLTVALQVCDGLTAAHTAGIIHRDIKPANLIVTPGGVVKICDFGVARPLDPSAGPNLTGPAITWGSPNYMAPEQINGEPIDRRTDLYALGCTLYAMLTGDPPFAVDGTFAILHQHMTAQPQPLAQRRSDVPRAVEALVLDLLAKAPEERPSDARVVRARITAAQADLALAGAGAVQLRSASPPATATLAAESTVTATTVEEEPRPGPSAGSPKYRRRTAAALAAATVAAAVVATVLWIVQPDTGRVAGSAIGPSSSAVSSPSTAAAAPPTPAQPSSTSRSTHARPTHAATPSHATTSTPSPPRTDPITALRQAIDEQVATGGLNLAAATDLNHMVDDLAKTIATGNTGEVTNKIKALRAKLTTLNKGRQLSDAGYRGLNAAVDLVAAAQPQPSSPAAPPPSPHH